MKSFHSYTRPQPADIQLQDTNNNAGSGMRDAGLQPIYRGGVDFTDILHFATPCVLVILATAPYSHEIKLPLCTAAQEHRCKARNCRAGDQASGQHSPKRNGRRVTEQVGGPAADHSLAALESVKLLRRQRPFGRGRWRGRGWHSRAHGELGAVLAAALRELEVVEPVTLRPGDGRRHHARGSRAESHVLIAQAVIVYNEEAARGEQYGLTTSMMM